MTARLRTDRYGIIDHCTVVMDIDEWSKGESARFDEIAAWVEENGFGRRTAYHMWRLDKPEFATLFLLKWN